jgi:hypothetical protein
MKKVFALVTALVLALSLAAVAAAADETQAILPISADMLRVGSVEEAQADLQAAFQELSTTFGTDAVKTAVQEALAKLDLPEDLSTLDAADLPENAGAQVARDIAAKLGIEGTDIAGKLESAFSNDFVSFIAQIYTGEVKTETTTKAQPPQPPDVVKTGDSAVIAIATFATLSAAAAVAFVCLKKKEA